MPSGIRPKSCHDILIFCRILENISIQISHSKQQRRSVRALFSVQTTERQSGSELRRFQGHTKWVNAVTVVVLPDGYVVSGSEDNTMRVWDVASGRQVSRLTLDAAVLRSPPPPMASLPPAMPLAGCTCSKSSEEWYCQFPKSTSAPGVEISRFFLPHPTASLLKVVCNIRRFAKGDRNLAQGEDRSWSTCR
jgi:WD40 repeat protein